MSSPEPVCWTIFGLILLSCLVQEQIKSVLVLDLVLLYQPHVAEVKQAEGSGGNSLCLDEVLQDVGGRGLDVSVVLQQRQMVINVAL